MVSSRRHSRGRGNALWLVDGQRGVVQAGNTVPPSHVARYFERWQTSQMLFHSALTSQQSVCTQ